MNRLSRNVNSARELGGKHIHYKLNVIGESVIITRFCPMNLKLAAEYLI